MTPTDRSGGDASPTMPSDDRVRAFFTAARAGDVARVREMIRAEPALADTEGPHPVWGGRPRALHVAVEAGSGDVVRALLDAGADPAPDSAAYDGWTPLILAASAGHGGIVRTLRDAGAPLDAWSAALSGDDGMLRALLDDDPALVRARGPNGATPLHFAGNVAVARLLVERGADLGARDSYGSTPVRAVAYARRPPREVGMYLLEAGAEDDVFLRCALDDRQAVADAVERRPDLLRATDPHLNAGTGRGGTLLHLAASLGNIAMAALLLERGADPNSPADEGETPLHYAAKFGDRAMAGLLLASGADATARDTAQDAAPAAWADFFGHAELALVLAPPGASP